MAKAVGHGQGCGGVAKAEGAWPRLLGRCQDLGERPRPWGRGQGLGGVAKAVGALSRPWGRGQGREAVSKAVGA